MSQQEQDLGVGGVDKWLAGDVGLFRAKLEKRVEGE